MVANRVNIVLELLFVYGFGWGWTARRGDGDRPGSAWAPCSPWRCSRAPARSAGPRSALLRPLARMGGTSWSAPARCCCASSSPARSLARVGGRRLAAHQIAFQLFIFLALVLDAIAIAGQVMVGRMLGAGDAEGARRRRGACRVVGRHRRGDRRSSCSRSADVLPRAFTSDPEVLDRAREMWPLFALMQPLGALVFALDGILLGAGDTRYLAWAMAFSAFACSCRSPCCRCTSAGASSACGGAWTR